MAEMLVTGGAGFIGSHLTDTLLMKNIRVCVFDNLSSGRMENIERCFDHPNFTFIKGDLLNSTDLGKLRNNDFETIFHLAANPEVRTGSTMPDVFFMQNVFSTYNLLEHMRTSQTKSTIVFASTSTVYGEATKVPTKESYAPLKPISVYGATKLASEALVTAYAYTYGFRAIICRLANIIGTRSNHGVVYDFLQKLREDPTKLEVLGDGTQTKSYIHIEDLVGALLLALERTQDEVEIYNVGSEDQVGVKAIAQMVISKLGLKNVEIVLTGGVEGGRGWKGDVKKMLLDIKKIESLGWNPKLTSAQAVARTLDELLLDRQKVNS